MKTHGVNQKTLSPPISSIRVACRPAVYPIVLFFAFIYAFIYFFPDRSHYTAQASLDSQPSSLHRLEWCDYMRV